MGPEKSTSSSASSTASIKGKRKASTPRRCLAPSLQPRPQSPSLPWSPQRPPLSSPPAKKRRPDMGVFPHCLADNKLTAPVPSDLIPYPLSPTNIAPPSQDEPTTTPAPAPLAQNLFLDDLDDLLHDMGTALAEQVPGEDPALARNGLARDPMLSSTAKAQILESELTLRALQPIPIPVETPSRGMLDAIFGADSAEMGWNFDLTSAELDACEDARGSNYEEFCGVSSKPPGELNTPNKQPQETDEELDDLLKTLKDVSEGVLIGEVETMAGTDDNAGPAKLAPQSAYKMEPKVGVAEQASVDADHAYGQLQPLPALIPARPAHLANLSPISSPESADGGTAAATASSGGKAKKGKKKVVVGPSGSGMEGLLRRMVREELENQASQRRPVSKRGGGSYRKPMGGHRRPGLHPHQRRIQPPTTQHHSRQHQNQPLLPLPSRGRQHRALLPRPPASQVWDHHRGLPAVPHLPPVLTAHNRSVAHARHHHHHAHQPRRHIRRRNDSHPQPLFPAYPL